MSLRFKQSIGMICIVAALAALAVAQSRRPARGTALKVKPTPSPTPVPSPTPDPKQLAAAAAESRARLMEASKTYQESLERLLALQKQDEDKAAALVTKRHSLLEMGVIAKREVEEAELALKETQKKTAETQQRMNEVEQFVAEVMAAEQIANQPVVEQEPTITSQPRVLLVRYTGRNFWALNEAYAKADAFFRARYSRPLPVSAFGQTETHNRLGFDHSNALDVAVHPDSAEGQLLQGYLRAEGISFIAIRGAIVGSATGAHIHIGAPSKRLGL